VPAILVAAIAWFFWIPATHILTFAPGEGLVDFLPAMGLGTEGGWLAIVGYVVLLGTAMFWRWRSGAWRRIEL
jgi:MATE family multidrug resistance protein